MHSGMLSGLEKVYGRHAVRAVVLTRPDAIKQVVIADPRDTRGKKYSPLTEEYLGMVAPAPARPQVLPWGEFFRTTGLTKDDGHQGICIFTRPRTIYGDHEIDQLESARLVLALDQVSNPRNMGTILRSAAYFGADAVMSLRFRSAEITPEVVQIASGGAEFLRIYQVTNLVRGLEQLKKIGYWIYGLEERGAKTIAETVFDTKMVLVVGAEGQGMRQKTKGCCDFHIRIPGSREGLESLNAAVAASIALAQVSERPFFARAVSS